MRGYLFTQLWTRTDKFLVDFWPHLVAAQQTASSSRRQKEEAAEQAAAELVGATDSLGFFLSFPFRWTEYVGDKVNMKGRKDQT